MSADIPTPFNFGRTSSSTDPLFDSNDTSDGGALDTAGGDATGVLKAGGGLPSNRDGVVFNVQAGKAGVRYYFNSTSSALDFTSTGEKRILMFGTQANATNRRQLASVLSGGQSLKMYSGSDTTSEIREWVLGGSDTFLATRTGIFLFAVDPEALGTVADVGAFDATDVLRYGHFTTHGSMIGGASAWWFWCAAVLVSSEKSSADIPRIYGSSSSWQDLVDAVQGTTGFTGQNHLYVEKVDNVINLFCPCSIGNSSQASPSVTAFDDNGVTVVSPSSNFASDPRFHLTADSMRFYLDLRDSASDTATFSGTYIWGTEAPFDFSQANSAVVTLNGANFSGMGEFTCGSSVSGNATFSLGGTNKVIVNGADLDGSTINGDADFQGSTVTILNNINITGTLNFDTAGTYNLVGCTIGEVTNSSGGSVTLNADLSSTITTNTGPNITIVFPTLDLTVTSSETGSLIQVFTTTTQTILASTTGTSLVYTHSEETVDIVVQKAGFIPFRQTGVVLSGNVPIQADLVTDLNYLASHGLTYTTDASWSRTNNELTVPTWGVTGQAVYSLMIDSFIAESTLRNTAFNLQMNGPQSLIFINDAEGVTDGDITNLTQCGVEYRTSAGVETAEWTGFQSSGVVAGSQPEFEQVSGGTVVDARTTGNVNELIKTFGDATHGNFDYRNYFDWKVQTNGYRQAETDILTAFGISQLSPILYIFSLTEIAIDGLVLGDPSPTGLSLTDDSAAPVSWDAGDGAKDYSITITDTGSNSGETILRWLNYNLSLDATFEGKDPFDWPEMVLDNGAAYETLRGLLHKAGGDVLAGVRVIDGSGDHHPDFTRFQADDGTYGTPPNKTTVTAASILDGARYLRFINGVAAAAQVQVSGGTGISETLVEGVDYTAGQTIVYWVAYVSGTTAKMELLLSGVLPSGGGSITFVESMQDCPVYNTNAIDGSLVTGYAHDDANDEVDITIAPNWNIKEMYAWMRYQVYSDRDAMLDFFQEIDGQDVGNYRLNDTRLTIRIDNTNAAKAKETSGARLFTATGDGDPIKNPTTNGPIDLNWREPVLIAQDADIESIKATIDTNLDATVSSRSTQTSVDTIQSDLDTNLDATVSSRATQTSVDSIPTSVPTVSEIVDGVFDEIV